MPTLGLEHVTCWQIYVCRTELGKCCLGKTAETGEKR